MTQKDINKHIVSALSCHTASGHVRQSNAIKVIGVFLGKHYQAFHAVSSMCVGSLSWSQFVRVSASGGIKEALSERRYSDVFYLSVKYIQRGGSLSKELKSMKRNKTHTSYWNSLPQIQESVRLWPVHAHYAKCKNQLWSVMTVIITWAITPREIFLRSQFKIWIKELLLRSCISSFNNKGIIF